MTEKMQQCGRVPRFSFKHATLVVCFFNLVIVLLLLFHGFLSPPHYYRRSPAANQPNSVLLRHIKECDEVRRSMEPHELIKRIREIQTGAYPELEPVPEKDTKQSAAVDLILRLNNYRSSSDAGSVKALEEWRKRKMERARQRELGKNGTGISQA